MNTGQSDVSGQMYVAIIIAATVGHAAMRAVDYCDYLS